ncbi:ABC transporter permease [candidate division KSB3 bacterium]|uniref:ABC transporter permease n=1 Tax=candidate division KSB3 bacterium TaxID=2044937 RepID=A0A2G6E3D8_9BACT|nr:MAG: ABC transporter permease [candidate division KSB3 bacterium]PIE28888.1 MAG: ABC transporter permease [candidate division KSB3 bacterium]
MMKKFHTLDLLNRDRNLVQLFVIAVVVFVLMSVLNPGKFLTLRNFESMSFQFPEFGILAIAMMISMLTGGIDLSVVGIANFAGILAALLLTNWIPEDASHGLIAAYIFMAILVAIITGITCGLLNGFLIAWAEIPPILATLGTMQLFTGVSIVITKGYAVTTYPEQFLYLGNGLLGIFPLPFLIFAFLALLFACLLRKTRFGITLYMMGSNPTASRFSGVNNSIMLMKTYMITGCLAGIAGLVMIARTNSAKADYGASYILQSVLIAVLGGVNPSGGFGTILGIVVAILSLQFLSSGFNMLRFNNFAKEFTWGVFLLFVMVFNHVMTVRRAKRAARAEAASSHSG